MPSSIIVPVTKSIAPRLVPFFKTVCIYFVLYIPAEKPSIGAAIIKCLPIYSLILFIVLYSGISWRPQHRHSRLLIVGLAFSSIGDALLIWPAYFQIGMISFAAAHWCYIKAFGWQNINLFVGLVLYALACAGLRYMSSGFDAIMTFAVPIYTFILATTVWRATDRIQFTRKDTWTWTQWSTLVGAALFSVSDFFIGVDKFKHPVEYAQGIIMGTYYGAQLGISLSVVDAMAPKFPQD